MTVLTVALIDNLTHGMIICVSLRRPSERGRVTSVHRPPLTGLTEADRKC